MIALLITISVISAAFSGIAKAICDLSEEGKLKGNPLFWHKNVSCKNKWKDGDKSKGEKFFGSSRWFVMFTDAWHLFGLIERVGFIVTYVSIGILIMYSNWYWFMLLNYPLFALIFHLFYNSKILRKW